MAVVELRPTTPTATDTTLANLQVVAYGQPIPTVNTVTSMSVCSERTDVFCS